MIVFVALPEIVGVVETEAVLLNEQRVEALEELDALIMAGYSEVSLEKKYTPHGVYQVFGMERKADQTDLDPQTQTMAG